jgi:hypothetical protein
MAGKNLSADRYAHGAVRVMPPSIAMGQAAGSAAALASQTGASASKVPYDDIRRVLIENGAFLDK